MAMSLLFSANSRKEIDMSAKLEKSSSPIPAATDKPITDSPSKPIRVPVSKMTGEQIKARINELDAEISDLVERTIKNIAPGRGFDRSLIRQMNKAQREKHRIVAARFTSLLDLGHPEAKELLNKLMQIPA